VAHGERTKEAVRSANRVVQQRAATHAAHPPTAGIRLVMAQDKLACEVRGAELQRSRAVYAKAAEEQRPRFPQRHLLATRRKTRAPRKDKVGLTGVAGVCYG